MNIGQRIKDERLKMGWTQTQLAEQASVGLNFVYQLENEKPSVQLDSVSKVLKALGLKICLQSSHSAPIHFTPTIEKIDPWSE